MTAGRPLSPVEHAFWLLDRAASFNGVNTAHFRGPIRTAHVRQALDWVQRRHALLQVAIAGDPPVFEPVAGSIPLSTVRRSGPLTWRAAERSEINTQYRPHELLCRAVWVEGDGEGELIISHQHVIADAQSAVIMMREIAQALGAIVAGRPLPPPDPLPLRAAFTALLRPTLGAWQRLRAMNWFFFRNVVTQALRRPRRLTLDRPADFAERRLGIVHASLDEPATEALARRCRAEGTTVQGAVAAALLLAAADSLELTAPTWLACFSAVSLRERLRITDEMGLYISQVTTYHQVARSTAHWALAREVKRDLARTLSWGEQFVTIPMIGMFIPRGRDPGPRFARRFDLASPATVGLSNIGRIDLPREVGPIALESFHLAVGPSVVAPLAACASTLHGRLSINLVFVEPLITEARAQALADGALARLGGGRSIERDAAPASASA